MINSCPKCKNEIPTGAPESVCPKCLLENDPVEEVPFPKESLGQIGNFTLVEEIARGGMGVVYKAYQEDLNRTVAIKMIRGGRFADDRELQRFQAEAEAAANLRHPGIVAIHQVGAEDGNHFFAMDFVAGGDLESWQKGQPMEDMQAAHLIKEITIAVAYAHSEGIIHRDLKPQNILMDADGNPHVSDFGIAKRLDCDSQLTITGVIMGSPSYMSPEQASGATADTREASDIYSLGAILYALLTGRPPFQAATPMKTLEQVSSREPVPPRALNPSISEDLNTICLKCLNKSPHSRYQSAEDLIAELERFCSGMPILARPISKTEATRKWVKRNPLTSALSAAIAAVALIGFLSVWWQLEQTRDALATAQELQRAEISARAPRHTPKLILPHEEEALSVAFAPNGTDLLTACKDGYWRVFTGVDGGLSQKVQAHEGLVAEAVYSSSGKEILTFSYDTQAHFPHLNPNGARIFRYTSHDYGDQTARLWDPAKGKEILAIEGSTQISSAKLSPDGNWIATANWDGVVTIYERATGTKRGSYQAHEGAIEGLHFSSDSKSIVTSSEGNAYQMTMTPHTRGGSSQTVKESSLAHVLEVPSGKLLVSLPTQARNGLGRLPILSHLGSSRSTARFSPDGTRIVTTGEDPENNCLWNAQNGNLIARLKGHSHSAYMAAFSPNGHRIATAGADNTTIIWNGQTGERLTKLQGHDQPVLWTEFSPDSRLLVTASADGSARVWSVSSGICISVLKGHTKKVYRAHFSPDGLRVATASEDGNVCLWDAASMDYLSRVLNHEAVVLGIEFSEDSTHVVTRDRDGEAKVWNPENATGVRAFTGLPEVKDADLRQQFTDETLFARLSPDSSKLVAFTEESKAKVDRNSVLGFGGLKIDPPYAPLRIWNVESAQLEHAFPKKNKGIASVDLSPDGGVVAAGQHEQLKLTTVFRSFAKSGIHGNNELAEGPTSVWLWDTETGDEIHELQGHEGTVQMVGFSDDGSYLVSADRRETRLWETSSGNELFRFEKSSHIQRVDFLPGGKEVLLASSGRAGIWSLATGDMRTRFFVRGPSTDIRHSAISPDGKHVACLTDSNIAYLCSSDSGEVVRELSGHQSMIKAVTFHPSNGQVATASEDKTIKVWDASTGKLIRTLEGHTKPVTSLTFSPDGEWLGSTSRDFTARLWPVRAF
ncbi:serine/threonine protein kinase [Verrucomicrobiales bacterium]|jgi:WD40 repeat protein/tRNA A-37 threonylcarbamoyl transferase component Bud32|nr:serine/threonine protein kinase [Verrucomicrobiales bacterium]